MTHIAYLSATGKKDVNIIPEQIFRRVVLPHFNDRGMIDVNADKNTYDITFSSFDQAYTVLKRVRGHYIVNREELIKRCEVEEILLNDSDEYIIKASDTNNGVSINKLKVVDRKLLLNSKIVTLDEIEKQYGFNFLVQRVIRQHKVMSEPHPSSVNTLRMVTLRWNGEISNVYTFARIGVNNEVKDNLGARGLAVGVKDDGNFMPYGFSSNRKVDFHPTNGFPIQKLGKIPNFDRFLKFARELHKKIIHHDYISWDIAVGEDGQPILVEANFFGTCFAAQVALEKSLFGQNTSMILEEIRDNREGNIKKDLKIRSSTKLEKRLKKAETKNRTLSVKNREKTLENKKNLKKVTNLKKQLSNIKNSRSWKYTRFFRREKNK